MKKLVISDLDGTLLDASNDFDRDHYKNVKTING